MTTVVDASKAREGDRIDSRFSIEDYEDLPNDGKRYEIIEGELIVNPAPNTRHQRLSRRLQFALYEAIEVLGRGEIFNAPFDVELDFRSIVQPDLVVVLRERAEQLTDRRLVGPPDVVVEILSVSTASHDRGSKLRLYARYGVPGYWIVDPEEDRLVESVLHEGDYRVRRTWESDEIFEPATLPGVAIDLAPIFAR